MTLAPSVPVYNLPSSQEHRLHGLRAPAGASVGADSQVPQKAPDACI